MCGILDDEVFDIKQETQIGFIVLSVFFLIKPTFRFQGLNAALFYSNPDPRTYVSLIPTSAVTGEGMGNLLAMIVQACEGPLNKRLVFSQQLLATVLEVIFLIIYNKICSKL